MVAGSETERMAKEVFDGWGKGRFEVIWEMKEGLDWGNSTIAGPHQGPLRPHPSHNFKARVMVMVVWFSPVTLS